MGANVERSGTCVTKSASVKVNVALQSSADVQKGIVQIVRAR